MTRSGAPEHRLDDVAAVTALLGRSPQGAFEVVVRDRHGSPVVIRNAALLDDGTPMPTRYWLVGDTARRLVGTLEADGGVRAAEAEVPAAEIAAAHQRYAAERDASIPAEARGPRPSGGVGGTRQGVKCLHAHYAWHLAGGADPVGRWVAERLRATPMTVDVGDRQMIWDTTTDRFEIPVGREQVSNWLTSDPPRPEELTNAIGSVVDHLDDLVRAVPDVIGRELLWTGPLAALLVDVEVGAFGSPAQVIARDAAEDLFRTLATESAAERATNPGLRTEDVTVALAGSCLLVAILRALRLDHITLGG